MTTQVYAQSNQVLTLGASGNISEANSGKVLITSSSTSPTYTLPSLSVCSSGIRYHIINGAGTTNGTITFTAPSNTIKGILLLNGLLSSPTMLSTTNGTNIKFIANTSVAGDYFDIYCNGSNYFVSGMSSVAGGITFS